MKWQYGRKLSTISALCDPSGDLTFEPTDMVDILAQRFFTQEPGNIAVSQPDDPPPRPQREFAPFAPHELSDLLRDTTSLSAPGFSGISWAILKRAWNDINDHFHHLADACVAIGYHPQAWRRTLVVVIPKPDRADYMLAKNFRPISLIECLSKLIEKGVSKRMLYDIDKHCLVPTTQFGMCAFSSMLDAGLTLMHDVQDAMR